MTLLSVVADRCKRDGICIEVCPARVIEFKAKDGYPALIEGGEALCIQCGHCVAVCPHGAMNHELMPADQCPPIREEAMITAAQAEQFLRQRRSIRAYKAHPVERELLSRLIHLARYAPSGHNTQPVEWRIVYHREQVQRLARLVIDWMQQLIGERSPLVESLHLERVVQSWEEGHDRIFRGAPHLIIAHAHAETRTAPTACTIALTYLELIATVHGIGPCWAGYFTAASQAGTKISDVLDLPDGHMVFGALMMGYPKYRYYRLPLRNEPRITWQQERPSGMGMR